MDYRRFFRQAMMLTITTGLLASCSKDNNVGEPEADEQLVSISPGIALSAKANGDTDGTSSPAMNQVVEGLTFSFLRADNTKGSQYVFQEEPFTGTCSKPYQEEGTNDIVAGLTFNPAQYYLINGKNTRMVGWYPVTNLSYYDYEENYIEVEFEIDGKKDVMVSDSQIGNKTDKGIQKFTFEHLLTQIQFQVTAESEIAAQQWGSITAISLEGESTKCTLIIDGEDISSDFSTNGTLNALLSQQEVPITYGENTPTGLIMIEGRTIGTPRNSTINLKITTTGKGEMTTAIDLNDFINGHEFKAGYAYKLTLNFLQGEITIKLTPANWEAAEGPENVDLAENQPYIISDMNYIVSRNMFGDAEGWIIRDETWTTTPTAESETSIPVILEVATENITDNATLDHLGCPEGWRVPSKTELELIQRYKDKLTKTSSSGSYIPIEGFYWSGTQNAAGATYYIDMATGEFGTASEEDGKTHHIRCVRDVEM